MKTIVVGDELYELLEAAADAAGKADFPIFLSELPQLQDQQRLKANEHRLEAERKVIQELDLHPVRSSKLWQKFAVAMDRMFRVVPERIELLEGLTKEAGRTIYVSKQEEKIRNSAQGTRPIRIKDTIWFINAQVGAQDAEAIIDASRTILGLSVSFGEELKNRTIRVTPRDYIRDYV